MEFWGVEVKPGKPTKIEHEYGRLVHISHASLGEVSKDAGSSISISLGLKINGKDFVIGRLMPEVRPQSTFDLVFEKAFELSHDWKDGSVYFLGYTADDPDLDVGELASEEEEEEEPVDIKEIGVLKLDDGAAADGVAEDGDVDEEDSDDEEEGDDKALDESLAGDSDSDDDEDGGDKAVDESLAGDSSDDISEQDSEDDDGDDDSEEEEEEELPKASKKRTASPSAPVFAKKAKSGARKNFNSKNLKGGK